MDEEEITQEGTQFEPAKYHQPEPPVKSASTEGPIPEDTSIEKPDWLDIKVKNTGYGTDSLFKLYGENAFAPLKTVDEYWKDDRWRNEFKKNYGVYAKQKFNEFYDVAKQEYSQYKLNNFTKGQSGFELVRDDIKDIRTETKMRFSNMAGTYEFGTGYTSPSKDYRENFINVRIAKKDADGNITFEIVPYTPELLESLEDDERFGGLAYSDEFRAIDPNMGINGIYYDVILDGEVYDRMQGDFTQVRNDQIVSRWDIETGSMLDGIFKNNKLETDSVLDYASIIVKSPINMWANMMDTVVQFGRAGLALGAGVESFVTGEDVDVNDKEWYKKLSTAGVKYKGQSTSMTQRAMTEGFFGSFENTLHTAFDVGLQVGLARVLGAAGSGLATITGRGLSGAALQQAQQRAAEVAVRGTLTAMASKDSYNESLEHGFTTFESAVTAGAMSLAIWKATKYASYILGDYEAKMLHNNLREVAKSEYATMAKNLGYITRETTKKNLATQNEKKAGYIMAKVQKIVDKVYGVTHKKLPPTRWMYAARQEGIEEMTEELYSDFVRHGASAWGMLMKDKARVGDGRYQTIFDKGFFKDAAERYATSAVAGAMGGPMGMIGTRVNLNQITSASTVTDIVVAGKSKQFLDTMEELKESGELGPVELSTDYNDQLGAFEPITRPGEQESLADMTFNTFKFDIAATEAFLHRGLFGKAMQKIQTDPALSTQLEDVSMRKDFSKLMGTLLEYHNKTGLSIAVFDELQGLSEKELYEKLPRVIKEASAKIVAKQNELEELRALSGKSAPDPEGDPKTEDKKPTKVLNDGQQARMERLEKELSLPTQTATEKDIREMLSIYVKVRAIANGTAAESYLIQNELYDSPVLGAMTRRKEQFKKLGKNPLIDLIMGARQRHLEDVRLHEERSKDSESLEKDLLEVAKDFDPELDLGGLTAVLKRGQGSLSEKAFKTTAKLYDKKKLKEYQDMLDPNNSGYMFADKDGDIDRKATKEFVKKLLIYSPTSVEGNTFEGFMQADPELDLKVIEFMAKDLETATIPIIEEGFGQVEIKPGYLDVVDVLSSINMGKASDLLLKYVGDNTILLRKISKEATDAIKQKVAFNPDKKVERSIDYLFKYVRDGNLTGLSVADVGYGVVDRVLSTMLDGKVTEKNTDIIEDVLSQIEARKAVGEALSVFTSTEKLGHYANVLAEFRKNTLDIIDFKYVKGSPQNTEQEVHPYKDHTAVSDFFADFLYNPIDAVDLINKRNKTELYTERDYVTHRQVERTMAFLAPLLETGEGEGATVTPAPDYDFKALTAELDKRYNYLTSPSDIKNALKDLRSKEILNKQKLDKLAFVGVTELEVASWLFKKVKAKMDEAKERAEALPYLTNKKEDIATTHEAFANVIEATSLKFAISTLLPEYDLFMAGVSTKTATEEEKGRMNIKIEKLLYDIYNDKIDLADHNAEDLKLELTEYLKNTVHKQANNLSDNREGGKAADRAIKEKLIIAGALTTDFTPFYSKFKDMLLKQEEERDDPEKAAETKLVLAAQEFSAKYTAAFIYSKDFHETLVGLSSESNLNFAEEFINAIYVIGTAGSGKTSAVTDFGMTIAASILEDQGVTTTAVLPVANNPSQVKNISKSVGDLSQGLEARNVDELLHLLESGAGMHDTEADRKSALEILDRMSTIVIDEATYIAARQSMQRDETGEAPKLKRISDLVAEYNKNRLGVIPISIVIMGDSKQTGAVEVLKGTQVVSTAVSRRDTVALPYLDFSFRARNSFMTTAINLIDSIEVSVKANAGTDVPVAVVLPSGLKHGMLNDRYYGVNMLQSTDRESMTDFIQVLNDGELIKNIRLNAEKDPENFRVIIAPEDVARFGNNNSEMQKLIAEFEKDPKFSKVFDVIPYDNIGGSEANYIIAEFPSNPIPGAGEKVRKNSEYLNEVKRRFNTLVTRAIDYIHIVNKSPDVVLPANSAIIRAADGDVIVPDADIDEDAKHQVRLLYLDIFSDIESGIAAEKPANKPPAEGSKEVDLDVDRTPVIKTLIDETVKAPDSLLAKDSLEEATEIFGHDPAIFSRFLDTMIVGVQASIDGQENIDEAKDDIQSAVNGVLTSYSENDQAKVIKLAEAVIEVINNPAEDAAVAAEYMIAALTNAVNIYESLQSEFMNKTVQGTLTYGKFMDSLYSHISNSNYSLLSDDQITSLLADGKNDKIDLINQGMRDTVRNFAEELGLKNIAVIDAYLNSPDLSKETNEDVLAFMKGVTETFINRAIDIKNLELLGFGPVPVNDQAFTDLKVWAITLERAKLEEYIHSTREALADGGITSMEHYHRVEQLLEKYDRNSVLERALEVLEETHAQLSAKDSVLADKKKRIQDLANQLEIQFDETTSSIALSDAITGKEEDIEQASTGGENVDVETKQLGDIEEIKSLYNDVFEPDTPLPTRESGALYYNRQLNRPEELDDFIRFSESIRGRNDFYTIDINKRSVDILGAVLTDPLGQKGVQYSVSLDAQGNFSRERALNLFNFDGKEKKIKPESLMMRVAYSKKMDKADMLLYAVSGDRRILIARFDNSNLHPHRLMGSIQKDIKQAYKSDPTSFTTVQGQYPFEVRDFPIQGKLKNILKTRPGKVTSPESGTGITFAEAQNLVETSSDLFVITTKSGLTSQDKFAGKVFALYNFNKDTDIDSSDLVDQLKKGSNLSDNLTLVATDGMIPTHLGVLPINTRVKLSTLSEVLKDVNEGVAPGSSEEVLLGEFRSNLGMAIQKIIAARLLMKDSKTGEQVSSITIPTDKGSTETIQITDSIRMEADAMLAGIDTTIKGDHLNTINGLVESFTSSTDPSIIYALDAALAVHLKEMKKTSAGGRTSSSILKVRKNSSIYEIAINKMLKVHSGKFLEGMNLMADAAGYTAQLPIKKGDKDTESIGVIEPAFVKRLAQEFTTSVGNVELPFFALTAEGTAGMIASLQPKVKERVVLFTEEAAAVREVEEAFKDDNNIDPKRAFDLNATNEAIAYQQSLFEKSKTMVKAEELQATIENNIRNLESWRDTLMAVEGTDIQRVIEIHVPAGLSRPPLVEEAMPNWEADMKKYQEIVNRLFMQYDGKDKNAITQALNNIKEITQKPTANNRISFDSVVEGMEDGPKNAILALINECA